MEAGTIEEALERISYMRSSTTFAARLFRSRKSGQVLYLEAGKDLVDTLFSFLLLPVGTIIHMLSEGIQVKLPALGGISSIIESLQNFTSSDLQVPKEKLVGPRPAVVGCTCRSTRLPMQLALEALGILQKPDINPPPNPGLRGDYYLCRGCSRLSQITRTTGANCGTCNPQGSNAYTFSQGPYSVIKKDPDCYTPYSTGFVKENSTFIVTDDLEIMPLTTNSVLSRLKVASSADLEGNDITVNITQILQLLHTALTSYTCLNEVFGKTK